MTKNTKNAKRVEEATPPSRDKALELVEQSRVQMGAALATMDRYLNEIGNAPGVVGARSRLSWLMKDWRLIEQMLLDSDQAEDPNDVLGG